ASATALVTLSLHDALPSFLVEHVAERRQRSLRGLDGERAVRRTQGGALLAEVALREWVGVACESQEQPEHGVGEVTPEPRRASRKRSIRRRSGPSGCDAGTTAS